MFTFATLRPKNGNFWADMKCAPDKAEEVIKKLPKKKQEEYRTMF